MSEPRTALVTGSAGFIGYFTCRRLLADGFRVVGVDSLSDYYDVELKRRRQAGLLQNAGFSAINQPINTYLYSDCDLFDIAAAYAFHIAQAQSFLDGNKRTAVAAAVAFLGLNGIPADFDSREVYGAMIAIAEHRMDKVGLAELLRKITT